MSLLPSSGYWPAPPVNDAGVPALVASTINAATDKYALIFRVPHSGDIETIEFRLGTVGNNPDNGLRISLQDLNSAGDPDGVQDQFRTIPGPFTSVSWITPGLITSDGTDGGTKRTVTAGQMLAVVIEFESFVASDSVTISGLDNPTDPGGISGYEYYTDHFDAGAWSVALNIGVIALKYVTDGYKNIAHDWAPILAVTATAYNTGSSSDEYALRFQVPMDMTIDGGWVRADIDGDADLVLYDSDGTTVLASGSFDASARPQTGAHNHHVNFSPVNLLANTTYRLALKPTTGTSVTLYGFTANSNALMAAAPGGGTSWYRSNRADAGSWTDETAERPWMGIHIYSIPSTIEITGAHIPSTTQVFAPSVGLVVVPGRISTYLRNKILDKVLKNTNFSSTPIWVSLHDDDPEDTGAGELAINRVQAVPTSWEVADDGRIVYEAALQFTGVPLGAVPWISLWDAESGGNFLWGGAFLDEDGAPFVAGSSVVDIEAGFMSVSFVGCGSSPSPFSEYILNKILDKVMRGVDFTVTRTYMALYEQTPYPAGAGAIAIPRKVVNWASAVDGVSLNSSKVLMTGLTDQDVTHFGLFDAITGGHFLIPGELLTPVNVTGRTTIRFQPETLSIYFDECSVPE